MAIKLGMEAKLLFKVGGQGGAGAWTALGNTTYFLLGGGPLTIALALAAAMLLNSRLVRWKGFFRTAFFAPVVTTLVAVAVVWRFIYHPRFGLLNYALSFLGIGLPPTLLGADPEVIAPSRQMPCREQVGISNARRLRLWMISRKPK